MLTVGDPQGSFGWRGGEGQQERSHHLPLCCRFYFVYIDLSKPSLGKGYICLYWLTVIYGDNLFDHFATYLFSKRRPFVFIIESWLGLTKSLLAAIHAWLAVLRRKNTFVVCHSFGHLIRTKLWKFQRRALSSAWRQSFCLRIDWLRTDLSWQRLLQTLVII